jgi:hypothetical protein
MPTTPAFSSVTVIYIIRPMADWTVSIVAQQIQEMQMVREKVYAMEQTHMALKQK